MKAGRWLGVVRLSWGAALLGAPRRCVSLAGDGRPAEVPDGAVAVARVLGGRHVLQGLYEVAAWPSLRRTGAAADLAHAASGVALAAVDRPWRRVALADAALAAGYAAAGLALR